MYDMSNALMFKLFCNVAPLMCLFTLLCINDSLSVPSSINSCRFKVIIDFELVLIIIHCVPEVHLVG